MELRNLRLRFRRRFRVRKRQVERLSLEAEEQLEERFFKRLSRLKQVRRFIVLWVLLFVALTSGVLYQLQALGNYYQTVRYVEGGTYNEGVVGNFSNANPIYATTTADTTVSRLLFAGLFKYDDEGKLVNDLAASIVSNDAGDVFTVTLKPGQTWHDGRPVTSEDVLYTFRTIQNPDAQSPLNASWQNIRLEAPDATTVVFTLPGALISFPYSLTTGLLPAHILKGVAVGDLRSAPFNTAQPVGAGPFRLRAIEVTGDTPQTHQQQIALVPFARYGGGAPKLDQLVVNVYQDKDRMLDAYRDNALTAMAGLETVPPDIASDSQIRSIATAAANMVFFKTTNLVLSDKAVRQALVAAADPAAIISRLGYKTPPVTEPFLQGQLGYDAAYAQKTGQPTQATSLLDAAGWVKGAGGQRTKTNQALRFKLAVQDTAENRIVVEALRQQWQAVGIEVQPEYQPATELQDSLTFHNYDALLYGITIGTDPDVFAYWDSSQADVRAANRLNFSEYSSATADAALAGGRTRADPQIRAVKYRPFLQAWQADAPALGLYQPRFIYASHRPVDGLTTTMVNGPTDRFSNVQNWMIRQSKVTNQ